MNNYFEQVAAKIARDLFTGGNGVRVKRLVQEDNHNCGWGEKPMADRIAMILMRNAKRVAKHTAKAREARP